MTTLALAFASFALYAPWWALTYRRVIRFLPPDIGLTPPPPVNPQPHLRGASLLAVPLDPATARALAQLCDEHDATPEQIVRRCVRLQARAECGR